MTSQDIFHFDLCCHMLIFLVREFHENFYATSVAIEVLPFEIDQENELLNKIKAEFCTAVL